MVVVDLTPGDHTIKWTLNGYETLSAKINVSDTGVVTCISVTGGSCGSSSPSGVTISNSTINGYLSVSASPTPSPTPTVTPAPADICEWIKGQGGWNNLYWSAHVLQAYYVYIGAEGKTIGYSPVTWNSVLGLYYYYMGQKDMGNSKTGCAFT